MIVLMEHRSPIDLYSITSRRSSRNKLGKVVFIRRCEYVLLQRYPAGGPCIPRCNRINPSRVLCIFLRSENRNRFSVWIYSQDVIARKRKASSRIAQLLNSPKEKAKSWICWCCLCKCENPPCT